jgi:hypothetical protein
MLALNCCTKYTEQPRLQNTSATQFLVADLIVGLLYQDSMFVRYIPYCMESPVVPDCESRKSLVLNVQNLPVQLC